MNTQEMQHQPIIIVQDYSRQDGKYAPGGGVTALSAGVAGYDPAEVSVCLHHASGVTELPLHRALDLTILTLAALLSGPRILHPVTTLGEVPVAGADLQLLQAYWQANKTGLDVRLKEIRELLEHYGGPSGQAA